jgi:hypothetical protein
VAAGRRGEVAAMMSSEAGGWRAGAVAATLWARAKARGSGGGEGGGTAVGQPDGFALISSRAKTAKSRSVEPTGKEEGYIYPTPFSPGTWFKLGLKTFSPG